MILVVMVNSFWHKKCYSPESPMHSPSLRNPG